MIMARRAAWRGPSPRARLIPVRWSTEARSIRLVSMSAVFRVLAAEPVR
jgi:hypothetical protein